MIQCPVCEREFKSLASHIHFKHGLTGEAFKLKYPGVKLVSEELNFSEIAIKHGVGLWRTGMKASAQTLANQSKAMSGTKNPFFGKTHSDETRLKMKTNHADFTGDNNPLRKAFLRDPEGVKSKLSYNTKNWWAYLRENPEQYKTHIEKLSRVQVESRMRGNHGGSGRGHVHGWFETPNQGSRIYYRSSYELEFLTWCYANNKPINSCSFAIPYQDEEGATHRYIPDFVYQDIVFEVKPQLLRAHGSNPQKEKAATEFCSEHNRTYRVVTEETLQNLELAFI